MIENAVRISLMSSKMYPKMLIRATIAAVAYGQTATAETNAIIWKQSQVLRGIFSSVRSCANSRNVFQYKMWLEDTSYDKLKTYPE